MTFSSHKFIGNNISGFSMGLIKVSSRLTVLCNSLYDKHLNELPQIERESFEKKMSNIPYVSARSDLFLQIQMSESVTFQHKIHYINFD